MQGLEFMLCIKKRNGRTYRKQYAPPTSLKLGHNHTVEKNKTKKRPNGDLKPEHKKTINRTTMGPTTEIDSQALTVLRRWSRC